MVGRDQVRGGGPPEGGAVASPTSAQPAVEALDTAADAKLVAEIAAGSERALARAYDRHGASVFALARRILGDARLAEEVVEDVFVCLWDESASFDGGRSSLRCHLLLDARSRSLALLRSIGAGQGQPRAGGPPRLALARGHSGGTEAPAVSTGADVLSPEERRVVELAYFEGLSCREAAGILDLTEATVRARIDSGLRRLLLADRGATGP